MEVSAVYYEAEGWWVGYVLEVPGVNTQGKTLDEAKANMQEALELALETRQALGLPAIESIVRESIRLKAS